MVMYDGKLGRKRNALARLETQLKKGMKLTHVNSDYELPTDMFGQVSVPLTEKDVERIKNEINILKERI